MTTDAAANPLVRTACLAVALLAAGCAGNPPSADAERSQSDPWEPMNRQLYAVNTNLDKATLKPVAQFYQAAVPQAVRTGMTNFSNNLRSPWNIVNNLLQGKGGAALHETGRLLANTTFGLLGILDVATDMGIESHPEDFGQTLAVWGVPDGPFVIVPFFGPQNFRDAAALPLDFLADPLYHWDNASVRDKLYILRLIDLRERFLKAEDLIEDAYDPYIRIREAYLQNRRYQVYDGNPPIEDDFYDDFYDDLDDGYYEDQAYEEGSDNN